MAGLSNVLGGVYGEDDDAGSAVESFSGTLELDEQVDEALSEWTFDDDDAEDEATESSDSPVTSALEEAFEDVLATVDESEAPAPPTSAWEPADEAAVPDSETDELTWAAPVEEPEPTFSDPAPVAESEVEVEVEAITGYDIVEDETPVPPAEELVPEWTESDEHDSADPSKVWVRSDDDIIPVRKGRRRGK